jgi:hypothetical protein
VCTCTSLLIPLSMWYMVFGFHHVFVAQKEACAFCERQARLLSKDATRLFCSPFGYV